MYIINEVGFNFQVYEHYLLGTSYLPMYMYIMSVVYIYIECNVYSI